MRADHVRMGVDARPRANPPPAPQPAGGLVTPRQQRTSWLSSGRSGRCGARRGAGGCGWRRPGWGLRRQRASRSPATAGDQRRGALGAIRDDLGQVPALGREHPVVDREEVELGQAGEQSRIGAVAAAEGIRLPATPTPRVGADNAPTDRTAPPSQMTRTPSSDEEWSPHQTLRIQQNLLAMKSLTSNLNKWSRKWRILQAGSLCHRTNERPVCLPPRNIAVRQAAEGYQHVRVGTEGDGYLIKGHQEFFVHWAVCLHHHRPIRRHGEQEICPPSIRSHSDSHPSGNLFYLSWIHCRRPPPVAYQTPGGQKDDCRWRSPQYFAADSCDRPLHAGISSSSCPPRWSGKTNTYSSPWNKVVGGVTPVEGLRI